MTELDKLNNWASELKEVTGIETVVTEATEEGIRQGTIDDGERYYILTIDGERYGSVTAYSNGDCYLFDDQEETDTLIYI